MKINILTTGTLMTRLGGDSTVEERMAGERKVADSWFDSRTGNACCILGKTLYAYFSWRPSSLPRCGGPT